MGFPWLSRGEACSLGPWSSTFLAPGTSLIGRQVFHGPAWGGWLQEGFSTLHASSPPAVRAAQFLAGPTGAGAQP